MMPGFKVLSREEPKERRDDAAPQWAVVLMSVLGGLLIITILFGMLTGTLGATTVALSLVTALGGLATGLLARYMRGGDRS